MFLVRPALYGLCAMLVILFPTTVFPDQYYDAMRQAIGNSYGAPDPNSDRIRTGDDFYNSDSSLAWWSVSSGSGTISIVTDNAVIHKVLKTTTSSSSSLVIKFPAQGSISSKKRSVSLVIADDDTSDGYGFRVEYKARAKIGEGSYKWYTLRYISENGNSNETGDTISYFLGSSFSDGSFHAINRNLEEDIKQYHSSYTLDLVDTLFVRGDVRISEFVFWERLTSIEGYANLSSVAQGGSIEFHVSMTRQDIDSSYYFEILRAGTTLESKYTSSTIQGHYRSLPSAPYSAGCGWPRDTLFSVPSNWKSGFYLVKLIASNGDYNYIPFVVRASSPGSTSKILFQVSDATWQAYNYYGGASYYDEPQLGRPTLSFDRPYLERYYYPGNESDTVGDRGQRGAGQFFKWEYPLVQWLESHGYSVEYCDNADLYTQSYGNFLDKYNLYLSVGHDEYVAKEVKDQLQSQFRYNSSPLSTHARDLSFFSGNNIFWRVIFQNGTRQIYNDYSDDHDFHDVTSVAATIGLRGKLTGCNRWYWNVTGYPLNVNSSNISHWIYRNTGITTGSSFGTGTPYYPAGISGYEIDYRAPSSTDTLEYPDSVSYGNIKLLADRSYGSDKSEAVYYEYPSPTDTTVKSRSKVFTSGCIQWSWGLKDSDSLTNKITKNIMDGLAATFRGHITQNMTWSGNIYLGGDVTIDSGVTVTINPATKIYFFPNNDVERTGGDTTKTRLIVRGTLTCLGYPDSIIFTSASTSPTKGDWGGIFFGHPGRGNISFTRFSYADTAIVVRGDTVSVKVRNSTFNHFKTLAVYTKSRNVNLGVAPTDCGKNNFFMKTADTNAIAVKLDTTLTMWAQGDWWDSVPPPESWFVGDVNYGYHLTQPATPSSTCPTDGGGGGCEGDQPCAKITVVDGSRPSKFELAQNYPNPFNAATVIRFALPQPSRVELRIYNILGQAVRSFIDEKPAGWYEAFWDGRDENGIAVSSGIYLYQIRAGEFVETKKMQLVK